MLHLSVNTCECGVELVCLENEIPDMYYKDSKNKLAIFKNFPYYFEEFFYKLRHVTMVLHQNKQIQADSHQIILKEPYLPLGKNNSLVKLNVEADDASIQHK